MISYNIHGILRAESQIPLYELEFFRVNDRNPSNDVVIQTAKKGSLSLSGSRQAFRKGKTLFYKEHFGALGAEFSMELNNEVKLFVSRLLADSKHVLYVNVVEPLLRFIFITKGYVLLHSACLSTVDGRGILISAMPDTGKTTTVLKCLRTARFKLLSDDMTIITPYGHALCFPKPFTISSHTLEAIGLDGDKLAKTGLLKLRSYIHSRYGRAFMRSLGKLNTPILTLNALGQILVKPPKFNVTEILDEVQISRESKINYLFFLEKEGRDVRELPFEKALEKLFYNSNDAFLFPPYSEIFTYIEINGRDFYELMKMEKSLLHNALNGVQIYELRSLSRSWDEFLLRLVY